MDRRISPQDRRPFPRTKQEWRERVNDAMRFGERVAPPLPGGAELVHRVGLLGVVALCTALFVAIALSPGVAVVGRTVGSLSDRFGGPIGDVEVPAIAQRSVVLDREGREIEVLRGEYCRDSKTGEPVPESHARAECASFENRIYASLTTIPKHTQQAILAIEDAKFYNHHGVDLQGLMRAVLLNFRAGGVRQGGSTITQQLVKNTLVGNERTVDRKIREARMAVRLEKTTSKEKILELYLNEAYFGNGVYGIGTAAEFYFGKPIERLALKESAMLAGIVKAPQNYEPLRNGKASKARRNLVLQRMADLGFITQAMADKMKRRALGATEHKLKTSTTPYLVSYVRQQLLKDRRLGATEADRERTLLQAGLKIETTLDLDMQKAAVDAARAVLNLKSDPSAALVGIDAETGAVRALVSHTYSSKKSFNLATQGRRQPGSTFKPFTMLAALDAGFAPSLTFDTPSPLETGVKLANGKEWKPENYSGKGEGHMDMRRATERSVNSYYVQLILKVGAQKVADIAAKMGIRSTLNPIASLSLGTEVVSPFELASAYQTLANNGVHCEPYSIARVTDAAGKVLLENEPSCERAIDAKLAAQGSDILRGIPERGTGRANGRIGRPSAAKTGTTDDYTDAWYVGYTPQFACVVWLGYPESTERPLKNIHGLPKVFGGSLPAMIWSRFMKFAHRGTSVQSFPKAPSVASTTVPDVTGKPEADARKTLEDAGFTVESETISSYRAAGTVITTDPAPGTPVSPGTLITMQISDGKAPSPKPSSKPKPSPTPSVSSPSPSASPSNQD